MAAVLFGPPLNPVVRTLPTTVASTPVVGVPADSNRAGNINLNCPLKPTGPAYQKNGFYPIIGLSLWFNINIMILSFFNAIFLFSLPGGSEWILILLAILLFFGGRKIPELMRGIGRGVREFKDAKDNVKNEIEAGMVEKDKDAEIKDLKKQLAEKQAS